MKHPNFYESFMQGHFAVHQLRTDQALKKAYNKSVKDPGGIIGITRRRSLFWDGVS